MGYKIEYSDDKVSAWGGFSVMKNFNDKLGLKQNKLWLSDRV